MNTYIICSYRQPLSTVLVASTEQATCNIYTNVGKEVKILIFAMIFATWKSMTKERRNIV